MLLPPEMQKQKAAPPKPPPACAVTGLPAKYKDPLTGCPYADAAAFHILRENHQQSLVYKRSQQQPNGLRRKEGLVFLFCTCLRGFHHLWSSCMQASYPEPHCSESYCLWSVSIYASWKPFTLFLYSMSWSGYHCHTCSRVYSKSGYTQLGWRIYTARGNGSNRLQHVIPAGHVEWRMSYRHDQILPSDCLGLSDFELC